AGIAPERALVFVTAGSVSNFARVAREAGLEIFSEEELEAVEDYPEGFQPGGDAARLARTLYATLPTVDSFRRMLSLWNAHQRGEDAPRPALGGTSSTCSSSCGLGARRIGLAMTPGA